jgi:hypothetical protein
MLWRVGRSLHSIRSLHALPKLLAYRVPLLRGAAEKSFQEPPAEKDYRLKYMLASI